MPAEVSHALYAELKKGLNEPALRKNTSDRQWFEIFANTPEEFRRVFRDRLRALGKVVKLSGVKLE